MPYLLRAHGVAVDRIADVVAIAVIPAVWYFVYSPVVDLGLRRRNWLLFSALGTGLSAGAAILLVSHSLAGVGVFLFLSSAISGLMSAANGSLLTQLSPGVRGRASGWYNSGNLGAGAVGAGLAIWLASRLSVSSLAVSVTTLIAAPALAAILINERTPAHRAHGPLFANLFRDLWDVLRSRRTLVGLVFFLSPVGSGAIANLISGLGPEYHASTNEVLWVTGVASGLLSALGSLVGGFVCDRMNRMKAYALSGVFTAAFAFYLGFAPPNSFTYAAGYSGYSIAVGFAYAVFTALVLEVLGPRRHAAGTSYSLLVASGNLPIAYMTWFDGLGYKNAGTRGLMGVDALSNGAGAVLLFLLAIYARRFWNKVEPPVETPSIA